MRDVVLLTESGKTVGFSIQPSFLKDLNIEHGDNVEIEIFKEYQGKESVTFTRPLVNIGGSKGVTIRYWLVKDLKLKVGETLSVDIRNPKEKNQ